MPFTAMTHLAPKCPVCKTFVYPAEQVMAADRKPFHKGCVKCFQCRMNLTPASLNNHEDQLFCSVCYEKIFNPSEFTSGDYTGIITPEDIERQKEKERLEEEKMKRALAEKRCPVCSMKIYPEGAIVIPFGDTEVAFCRTCVKCMECKRSFDGKDMALGPPGDENPKPYCKFCFAKAFGISALNITEMCMIAPEEAIHAQGL